MKYQALLKLKDRGNIMSNEEKEQEQEQETYMYGDYDNIRTTVNTELLNDES
jgi:hypothetical protein